MIKLNLYSDNMRKCEMVGGKVWSNEEAKTLGDESLGDFNISIKKHYDKYNIEVNEKLETDPMNSDYFSHSATSKIIIDEWIDDYDNAFKKYNELVAFYKSILEKNSTKRFVVGKTYIELWYNNVKYNITIGSTEVQQEQHTVFSTSSETDAVRKFIALSNTFRKILG